MAKRMVLVALLSCAVFDLAGTELSAQPVVPQPAAQAAAPNVAPPAPSPEAAGPVIPAGTRFQRVDVFPPSIYVWDGKALLPAAPADASFGGMRRGGRHPEEETFPGAVFGGMRLGAGHTPAEAAAAAALRDTRRRDAHPPSPPQLIPPERSLLYHFFWMGVPLWGLLLYWGWRSRTGRRHGSAGLRN